RIHGACHRLRRRRQTQSDQERGRRDRLDRKISRPSRLEAWRAVAAGGARPREPAVEGGRPLDPTSPLAMGGLGRDACPRKAVAERQHAGVRGAAFGTVRTTFLAYDNFQAYLKWNQSLNYSLTAAYYATRLDGAPAMNRGSPNIPKISFEETRELQQILEKRGYDVGRVDGVLGLKSRVAIRDAQIKSALPADGWPTAELLAQLRSGR